MIKGEWNYIRHNRLILISVLAIMFIPFLYCIFFLKSVWDPYGQTGSLPVAVVNQDQPVTYQGQKLNVGDQTVTNLKKNHQLGWKFVSAKTAADGLKHHKYYTVITFPKNFSANAATALNEHPKKMTFSYKTNGSANYIAQVMSEVGSSQLDSQIRSKVTKAYAQATFKQIYSVGKGMEKAATGSAKLKDGTVTLTDGLNTYTTGVHTLNNGLQQMKTSVGPLATGIQKLNTGAQKLNSGLGEYTSKVNTYASGTSKYVSGVNQFTGGVSKLSAGMPKLTSGANQVAAGTKSLNSGVYQYVNGVYTLKTGVKQLGSGVGPLANGVSKLYTGSKSLNSGLSELSGKSKDLNSGASTVAAGASKLSQGVSSVKSELNGLTEPNAAGQSVSDQIVAAQALVKNMQALQANPGLQNIASDLTPALQDLTKAEVQLNAALANQKAAAKTLKQDASQGQTTTKSSGSTDLSSKIKAAQSTAAKIAAEKGDSDGVGTDTATLQKQLAELQDAAGSGSSNTVTTKSNSDVTGDATELEQATQAVQTATAALQTALGKVMAGLNTTGLDATTAQQLQAVVAGAKGANLTDLQNKLGSLKTLADNSGQLSDLIDGANELSAGASTLSNGVGQYTSGVDLAFAGSTQLNSGISSLNAQVPTLQNGVTKIVNGTAKLAKKGTTLKSGSSKVASGASQVSGGLQKAAAGVNQLTAGTPKLAAAGSKLQAGTPKLVAGGNQLNQGASQVASGLTQLNSKVPALTSGVTQLADGSQKLDDNSGQLMSGAKKLSDGNGTLAKSLKSGADQIQAQPLTNKTADMFAAPTKLKHESYSYVPNYGHALAPYVLSVALYVGALVFNFAFPIRKVSRKDGTATGWFFSKVSIGAVEALAMGLIEPALMMLGGLSVDHPGQMMLVSVLFAEASMFIVMFLSMLLDNPGRFIAMVLLMLQLGGSGGTFPMEVTNHFYNVVHPFLPMTYSILGFRQAITSGMTGMVGQAVWVLILFTILALALLWPTMIWLQKKRLMGISQLDNNQELQAVEDPNAKNHS
ncbi:YhgE/Pip domain-containing protein [Levilactobacillus tongjiangensis]|uniref:YhgE/Pip family protein n=2 Tax=Levilactobacillus tongjiangensis TaxID=2486023 RepID=A0ABW1SQJ0_9LACO|nr:YhgE/Pip domain-containing protein [Levilactobacillus tongjiangensis]